MVLPQDPLFNAAKKAALKALDAAEDYFKLQNLDMAIKQAKVAKKFDPKSQCVDKFILAYQIHKAMTEEKHYYHVLGLQYVADYATVKKKYKELARLVHPDKNSSVAAEGAFKHVKAALDFLSDAVMKKAYDKSLRSPESPWSQGPNVKNTRERAYPKEKTTTASTTGNGYRCRGVFKRSVEITRTGCIRIHVRF